jgi:SAM domain (Sterile alpha motif)
MDVGGWLKSLGLGQYEALFRASDIDADILPELTDVDLEKLGVSLGHRKRLLRAISGLAAAEIGATNPCVMSRLTKCATPGLFQTGVAEAYRARSAGLTAAPHQHVDHDPAAARGQ